jgi:GNAT superfamily N-acetyltransferase
MAAVSPSEPVSQGLRPAIVEASLPRQTPRMDWTVRRATEDDAEAVRSVAVAGWRDTYRGLLRPETIEAFLAGPYDIENVRNRIAAHDFFVVEEGGEIGAYVDAVPEAGRVVLAAIYALPARRGHGAGSALLGVITSNHPALPIDAYVLLGNRKGETFYERRAFEPLETVEADLFGEQVTERRWRRSPQIRAGNSA